MSIGEREQKKCGGMSENEKRKRIENEQKKRGEWGREEDDGEE